MAKKPIIHVQVEPNLKKLLERHAKDIQAPISYVIRLALVSYLAEVKS